MSTELLLSLINSVLGFIVKVALVNEAFENDKILRVDIVECIVLNSKP